MYAKVDKPKENKSQPVSNSVALKERCLNQCLGFRDNRKQEKIFQNIQLKAPQKTLSGYKDAVFKNNSLKLRGGLGQKETLIQRMGRLQLKGTDATLEVTVNDGSITAFYSGHTGENGQLEMGESSLSYSKSEKDGKPIYIQHYIEAQPGRKGIATILSYVGATIAMKEGVERIYVNMANKNSVALAKLLGFKVDSSKKPSDNAQKTMAKIQNLEERPRAPGIDQDEKISIQEELDFEKIFLTKLGEGTELFAATTDIINSSLKKIQEKGWFQ